MIDRRGFLGALAALVAAPAAALEPVQRTWLYFRPKGPEIKSVPVGPVWVDEVDEYTLRPRRGIRGEDTLTGYEETLEFYPAKLEIDQTKHWAKRLARDATTKSELHKFMGEGPESIIRIQR